MPLRLAARKVPDAGLLPVDAPAYTAAAEAVMATLRAQPGAVVQVLGWDEAFVGVTTDDPAAYARRIRAAALDRSHLPCRVGMGHNTARTQPRTGFRSEEREVGRERER